MKENLDDDDLTMPEREALNGLAREMQPPSFLEERVVSKLREARLLHFQTFWRRTAPQVLIGIAASLLIFISGAVAGVSWWKRPAPLNPQFVLLLKAGAEARRPASPVDLASRVEEYSNWARQLRQQGVRVEGEKLKDEMRLLGEVSNQDSTDDESSGNQKIGGYFLIGAEDYNHAVRIAAGCPHLKHGGTIEVRQIDRF